MTTLRMAGTAPQVTVQWRYWPVASAVPGSVPSRTSRGPLAVSISRVNTRPPQTEP